MNVGLQRAIVALLLVIALLLGGILWTMHNGRVEARRFHLWEMTE